VAALSGCFHTGKGVGQGSSNSNEGDSGDTRLDTHDTAHGTGDLAYHGRKAADEADRCNEGRDAATPVRWWAAREQNFPTDREKVHNCLRSRYVGDCSVFVLLWMKHRCINELLAPGYFLFTIDSFEQLLQSISLFLLFNVSDYFNNCSVFL
jgi:hypothetical protein